MKTTRILLGSPSAHLVLEMNKASIQANTRKRRVEGVE